MRSKPKLPISSAGPVAELVLTESAWSQISKASYQRVLPDALRQQVLRETQRFVCRAEFEKNTPTVRDALAVVSELLSCAESLRGAIFQAHEQGGDASFYAKRLIGQHLKSGRLHGSLSYDGAVEVINEFIEACGLAKKDLETMDGDGYPATAWKQWVVALTTILQEHGLKTGVRHDSDKNSTGRASSFVMFISELQRQMVPKDYRRRSNSRGALARDISRARDKIRKEAS